MLIYNTPWEELISEQAQEYQKLIDTLSVNIAMINDPFSTDLIHAHTWYTFWAGFLAKKLYALPLVLTIHSLEPLRPWKKEQLGNGYNLSLSLEKLGIEAADGIIAVSQEMKKDILKYFKVSAEKIKVIYNGIDLKEYQYTDSNKYRQKYGIDLTKPYILFLGRITRQKGIIHLLNAIKDIDINTQIVLCAGAADTEEIAKEMTEKVQEIKEKRDNLIWIKEIIPKQAAIELYSQAAVFVCPSIYEPFGIINIEAMACQTPVVASAVGGIKEVVLDKETGFLLELALDKNGKVKKPETFAQNLATKINYLLQDEKLQKEFGQNGRKRVEELFAWEKVAKQTKTYYQQILKK